MAFGQKCETIYYIILNEQIRPNAHSNGMNKYRVIAALALGASRVVVIPTDGIASEDFN
jgi:hypothetical protein